MAFLLPPLLLLLLQSTCVVDVSSASVATAILYDEEEKELRVLGCRMTYWGQILTNAKARFNVALRPQKP